jgi:hypothetical protein
MKFTSTIITSAATLLLIAAPAFAQGAGTTSPGTPGTPGAGGSATTPCVGVNCPGGGMASPNTEGGASSSTPGTSVPDPSRRGNPVTPSTGLPMTERECLGGGWSKAGLPNASACFSAPGISR